MKHALPALLTIAMTVTGGPAVALSCLRPDMLTSYKQAAEAEELYVVVSGQMSHEIGSVPEGRTDASPKVQFEAQLDGKYLKPDGFTGDFAAPVNVTLSCVASWCATLPEPRADVLAFVQIVDGRYELTLGPCPMWLFDNDDPEEMVPLVQCHTTGDCQPAGN